MGRYDYGWDDPPIGRGWYPGSFMGGAPMFGWGDWGQGWPPYGYGLYAADYRPRRRPEESPTYGRGGDREARRYARRHGYDLEFEIRPRRRRGYGRYPGRGYDRR